MDLTFYYGMSGILGFNYDGRDYFYFKNLQGDVYEIYEAEYYDRVCVAKYVYDAWGKIVSITDGNGNDVSNDPTHIANINPIRYRSYYYDRETNLYYLESRYYDPETGRFLNADNLGYMEPERVMGCNLYTYCCNNPVFYVDFEGTVAVLAIVGLVGVLGLVLFTPSSSDQTAQKKQTAQSKYNSQTVNVFDSRGTEFQYEENQVNINVYGNDQYTNANIDVSNSIDDKYEKQAILDQFINSPYYSEELFGSREFMMAQWTAHNISYEIASSGPVGFKMMQWLGGAENPIESSKNLDIRSKNNILKRQKILYTIISWLE